MGAPRKYTARALQMAVDRYFKSITRIVPVTVKVNSGRRDAMGHIIWRDEPVENQFGETVMKEEYLLPPTVDDLSAFLGIHRSTWAEYCDAEKHPEFSDTTTRARGRMRAYLEREALTRAGKDVAGVKFLLEANYGYKGKTEIELGEGARKALEAQGMPLEEREKLMREIAEAVGNGS